MLKAGPGQVNKCTLQRQDKADRDSASYKEVLDVNLLRAKIQELLSQKVLTQDHPAVKKFIKFYVYIEDLQYVQYLQKPDDDDHYEFARAQT